MLTILAQVLEDLLYILVLAIASPFLLFLRHQVKSVRGEMVVDSELFADDAGADVDEGVN